MSAGVSVSAVVAQQVALGVVAHLSDACERIEVAGSLRRRRPEVHDIELVAIPRMEERPTADLWGTPETVDLLEERVRSLREDGTLTLRAVEIHRKDGSLETGRRDGDSYKALECQGIPLDLFIVRPPADWGVIFTIRTGPADWSHRLVTDCQRLLRRVEGGRLYRSGKHVPCPEERDFLAAIGQPWVEPWDRSAERVKIQAAA